MPLAFYAADLVDTAVQGHQH